MADAEILRTFESFISALKTQIDFAKIPVCFRNYTPQVARTFDCALKFFIFHLLLRLHTLVEKLPDYESISPWSIRTVRANNTKN